MADLPGLLHVACCVSEHEPFECFDDLEDFIASTMTHHCDGYKDEYVSAWQVALNICSMRCMCRGRSSQRRPHMVRMRPGARAGFYHSCKAKKRKAKRPKSIATI